MGRGTVGGGGGGQRLDLPSRTVGTCLISFVEGQK